MATISGTAGRMARRLWSQPETLGDGDCEALRGGLLGQPVNTLTSMGYVAGGSWLATRRGSADPGARWAAGGYAAALALSGAGSVAYHGPQFPGAQLFHDLPVAALVGIGAAVPVVRVARRRTVIEPRVRQRAVVAAGMLASATVAYLAGRTGSAACRPDSKLQLHGLWHLGTAGAATLWGAVLWPGSTADGARNG